MEVELARAIMQPAHAHTTHASHAAEAPTTSAHTTVASHESGLLTRMQAAACAGIAVGAAGAMVLLWLRKGRARRQAAAEAARRSAPIQHSEIIVLGCGSSTGVPRAACVVDPNSECKVRGGGRRRQRHPSEASGQSEGRRAAGGWSTHGEGLLFPLCVCVVAAFRHVAWP